MRAVLFVFFACLLSAQEVMPTRSSPSDYKAHAQIERQFTIAAEFQGRTVPAPGAAFILQHYVVVEVALFTGPFEFNSGQFSLRLNGKQPLLAQTPGMVGASLKYANWENQRQITATAGVGNADVIFGRQDTQPRFPGDRRPPRPPAGTLAKEKAGNETEPWDWVNQLAWQDGPGKGPAGGLLYFPYKGDLGKLKTIELIYHRPDGLTTLALRGSAASPTK